MDHLSTTIPEMLMLVKRLPNATNHPFFNQLFGGLDIRRLSMDKKGTWDFHAGSI